MMIVESLCAMLHNMASHKEEYSKMIISLLTQYYVKCFEQYQGNHLFLYRKVLEHKLKLIVIFEI